MDEDDEVLKVKVPGGRHELVEVAQPAVYNGDNGGYLYLTVKLVIATYYHKFGQYRLN